jgi:hypothetical protein
MSLEAPIHQDFQGFHVGRGEDGEALEFIAERESPRNS